MGHIQTEHLRDELIAELAGKHCASMTAALAAGDAWLLHDVMLSWTESLGADEIATALPLVRVSFAADAAIVGQALCDQLSKIVADMAETAAIKEVEQMERDGAAARDEARIDSFTWHRDMAALEVA